MKHNTETNNIHINSEVKAEMGRIHCPILVSGGDIVKMYWLDIRIILFNTQVFTFALPLPVVAFNLSEGLDNEFSSPYFFTFVANIQFKNNKIPTLILESVTSYNTEAVKQCKMASTH